MQFIISLVIELNLIIIFVTYLKMGNIIKSNTNFLKLISFYSILYIIMN